MTQSIGIVGCGAIGQALMRAADSGKLNVAVAGVTSRNEQRAHEFLGSLDNPPPYLDRQELIAKADLLVETAGGHIVEELAKETFAAGKDLMVISIGALLEFPGIIEEAREKGCRLLAPSGAIAGLDALKAVKDELESVVLVTTKNPNSLKGAPFFDNSDIDPEKISEPTVLFDGAAKEAVSLFPKNVNVSALLSLVGLGGNNTSVRVVADPNTDKNTHEINANGKFGNLKITVENVPDSTNPKTSRLATLSAVELLRQICTKEVQIGT